MGASHWGDTSPPHQSSGRVIPIVSYLSVLKILCLCRGWHHIHPYHCPPPLADQDNFFPPHCHQSNQRADPRDPCQCGMVCIKDFAGADEEVNTQEDDELQFGEGCLNFM